ncbi:MAG: nitroreductase family protein [Alphaproteobacteria bacterium]
MSTLSFLQTRRSVKAADMPAGRPDADTLEQIIAAGLRVPDHGKLAPWRIVVIEGDARRAFGDTVLRPAFAANQRADAPESTLELEAARFERAGVVLAVLSIPTVPHKIPLWEQHLSAGAVCQNIVVAAQSEGYATQWLTEWTAFDPDVKAALGATEPDDQVAGFIYIGGKLTNTDDRPRPEYNAVVSRWSAG